MPRTLCDGHLDRDIVRACSAMAINQAELSAIGQLERQHEIADIGTRWESATATATATAHERAVRRPLRGRRRGYPLDAVLANEGLAPKAWPGEDSAVKQKLVAEPALCYR